MIKKYFPFILLVCFVFGIVSIPEKASALSGNEPTYTYWMQSSKKFTGNSYGKWKKHGNTFVGPGNFSTTYKTKTGFSITGNGEIPIKAVTVGLEVGFTKDKVITTKASRRVPAKKTGKFQVRNEYKHYKVKMVEWLSMDGRKSKTGKVKYVKVKKKTGVQSRIVVK